MFDERFGGVAERVTVRIIARLDDFGDRLHAHLVQLGGDRFDFLDLGERKLVGRAFGPVLLAVARQHAVILKPDFVEPSVILASLLQVNAPHSIYELLPPPPDLPPKPP